MTQRRLYPRDRPRRAYKRYTPGLFRGAKPEVWQRRVAVNTFVIVPSANPGNFGAPVSGLVVPPIGNNLVRSKVVKDLTIQLAVQQEGGTADSLDFPKWLYVMVGYCTDLTELEGKISDDQTTGMITRCIMVPGHQFPTSAFIKIKRGYTLNRDAVVPEDTDEPRIGIAFALSQGPVGNTQPQTNQVAILMHGIYHQRTVFGSS